jgi:hypothetical protein
MTAHILLRIVDGFPQQKILKIADFENPYV